MIRKIIAACAFLSPTLLVDVAVAADVTEGQRLYQMHCAACHGVRGESLMPNVPNFSRGDRLLQPDVALLATVKAGKMGMPAFNGILRDQQILDVVAYLRTLQR